MAQRKKLPKSADAQPDAQPDTVTIDGQELHVEPALLDLDKVQLDPRNPRIAHTLAVALPHGVDIQEFLEEHLWQDSEVKDLYRQVKVNGGLTEPIIVRHDC